MMRQAFLDFRKEERETVQEGKKGKKKVCWEGEESKVKTEERRVGRNKERDKKMKMRNKRNNSENVKREGKQKE